MTAEARYVFDLIDVLSEEDVVRFPHRQDVQQERDYFSYCHQAWQFFRQQNKEVNPAEPNLVIG
jgi:hypothetical protein